MPLSLPPQAAIDAIHGSVSQITRRVEFYEFDGVTPWLPEGTGYYPGIQAGSVSIDQSRDERRVLDLTFYDHGDLYRPNPTNGLWYDKIIKVFRGVTAPGITWERQLGLFRIDSITKGRFPNTIKVTARDRTKDLRTSQFPFTTLFPENHPIEEIVRAIAVAGGITGSQMNLPLTGKSTSYEYSFDSGGERWAAIKEVCTSYGYEVFFTNDGILTMRQFQDPYAMVPQYTFQTGVEGNLASYDKSLSDNFLRNHIVVIGENASQVPVFAEAENTSPTSPTRIARVGRRTEKFDSAFVETYAQALEVAQRFLKVKALEQYEVSIEAIVTPYMDVGEVVEIIDPNPSPGDPTKFLLQNTTIPLVLGPMSASAGRVINIEPS
jgi:hypothetical protein